MSGGVSEAGEHAEGGQAAAFGCGQSRTAWYPSAGPVQSGSARPGCAASRPARQLPGQGGRSVSTVVLLLVRRRILGAQLAEGKAITVSCLLPRADGLPDPGHLAPFVLPLFAEHRQRDVSSCDVRYTVMPS